MRIYISASASRHHGLRYAFLSHVDASGTVAPNTSYVRRRFIDLLRLNFGCKLPPHGLPFECIYDLGAPVAVAHGYRIWFARPYEDINASLYLTHGTWGGKKQPITIKAIETP